MGKTFCYAIPFLAFFVGALPAPAGSEVYRVPEPLEELFRATEDGNDGLRQIEAEIDALLEEVPAARALDDPMLTLGINALPTDTYSFNQEPMTQKQVILAQKFPWFGKLDLRSQRVALEAARKTETLRARRLELRREVAESYFELAFVDRSIAVNRELNEMVVQILRIAEAAYASGRGLQQDVLQAQVELGKLIDEKAMLENRRRQLNSRINELVNRHGLQAIDTAPEMDFPETLEPPAAYQERALARNPRLSALQLDIDRAQVDIELARKAYYPDMNVLVGYGQRQEDLTGRDLPDFVSGAVTINLPIWFRTKQDKQLNAAMSRRKAAENAYAELRKRIPHQMEAIFSELRTNRENHRLFSEALLIQTEQWTRASLSAYEVGKVDFDTMIDAHLRQIRFGLQAERYLYSMYQGLARLEELTAPPLPSRSLPEEGDAGGRPVSPAPVEETP